MLARRAFLRTGIAAFGGALLAPPLANAQAVRITTTDALLHGLVAPALLALNKTHPLLSFDLHIGNELASLTRRDDDVAVRATKRPQQHRPRRKATHS